MERAGGFPPEDAPVVLVEKQRNAIRLAAVDRQALALGLQPGMTLADARARVPQLAVFDADPHADHALLEQLAEGCSRYTPMVAVDGGEGLLLDITGCAHLFGGERGLVEHAAERLERLGMTVRHALAGTLDAAHALARFQNLPAADEQAAVRRLPIAALELEGEAETALRRAGLKTIADLADRPLQPLAARFGEEAATRLRRLLALESRPLSPRIPVPMLMLERRFAEPIARTAFALEQLGDLVAEAAGRMLEGHQGGRRFEARFFRSDGLVQPLCVETSLPTRDPALVVRLFDERVESLSDPLDPGFGFDLIRLAVPVMESLAPDQLQLDGGGLAESEMAALIDRLGTRLGRGRVRRLHPRATHIPEQSCLALPAAQAPPAAEWPQPIEGEPPLRPLHLFNPPQSIEVMAAEFPDGPPRRFRWRRKVHDVRLHEGPERIAAEWWRGEGFPHNSASFLRGNDEEKDGTNLALTRDYFRVEDMRGRRFWIFRHGLYEEKEGPRWYLHGLFA